MHTHKNMWSFWLWNNKATSNLLLSKITISGYQWLPVATNGCLLWTILPCCSWGVVEVKAVTTVVSLIPKLIRRDEKLLESVIHLEYIPLSCGRCGISAWAVVRVTSFSNDKLDKESEGHYYRQLTWFQTIYSPYMHCRHSQRDSCHGTGISIAL